MENNYQKLLEQFRIHYKERFDVLIDDDILYLLIRINELHRDLKDDIKSVPEVRFRNGWDYFLYGFGKQFYWFNIVALLIICAILCIR